MDFGQKKFREIDLFDTAGQKILKSPDKKKLVKSNKSISRNFILTKIPFFAISKKAKNQFFNWEKVLNCQKCNFT